MNRGKEQERSSGAAAEWSLFGEKRFLGGRLAGASLSWKLACWMPKFARRQ